MKNEGSSTGLRSPTNPILVEAEECTADLKVGTFFYFLGVISPLMGEN